MVLLVILLVQEESIKEEDIKLVALSMVAVVNIVTNNMEESILL